MWHMIRSTGGATSAPRLTADRTVLHTIEQGVAQGCPMSPILFDICIDDPLESTLHRHQAACSWENRKANQSPLRQQRFADDISSPQDLQKANNTT
jgi:hypothetical protein